MNLPARVDQIVRELYAKNQNLANGTEDQRRLLTRMMAQQVCFELGAVWGTKATSSQAPQSKDSIAYKVSTGVMDIWDWQDGTSRQPKTAPNQPPTFPNVMGQYFIEVAPTDHLGGGGTGPGPTPPDSDLEERVATLEAQVAALQAQSGVYPSKIGLRSVQSLHGTQANKVLSVWDQEQATANRDSVGIGEEFVVEPREWKEIPK